MSMQYYRQDKALYLKLKLGKILTIVLMACATICVNLATQIRADMRDGLPGGCWNAGVDSSLLVQNSSSTSRGKSKSKLIKTTIPQLTKHETTADAGDVLFFTSATRST